VPGRRLSWLGHLPNHNSSDSTMRLLGKRMNRRAAASMSAGGLLALTTLRANAQEAPPIEPIGTDGPIPSDTSPAPEAPIEILPESTLSPDEVPAGEDVGGTTSGEEMYFAATGHNLGTPFLDTWRAAGGFEVLGAPLSEARYIADVVETHQTFETLTLTYDPDLEYDWRIQALHLDQKMINRISTTQSRRKVTTASRAGTVYPETGHTLSGSFLSFWEQHGGVKLFGLPVTEPFSSSAGTTQIFERVVMDQAANGTVTLRRIGREWVRDNNLEGDEAFVAAPPNNGQTTMVRADGGLRLRGGPSEGAEIRVILPDNAEFIAVAGAEGEWLPGYVDGYSGWVASAFLVTPTSIAVIDSSDWDTSVWQGAVLSETNVRAEPTTSSPEVRVLAHGEPVVVVDWVRGEEVVENSFIWAQLDDGNYVFARNVGRAAPVQPPPVPDDAPWEGKWIDVHLTQQLMVAYEGRTPVRTVVTTTGMPGWETPTGWFAINTRVENETMDSGAIGAEYFYKLEDVLYTQYFSDRGHALHYAWWRTPETIGRPGSHGCLNMLLADSRFFWDWASIGTPVIVRRA
jgi:hypothetical protein